MMRRAVSRIKPARGFSKGFHWILVAAMPVLVLAFVIWNIMPIAYAIVILSKWRMFAIRPRHWPASIRANAVDIIAGLSIVAFMAQAPDGFWRLIWLLIYEIWLLVIKPRSKVFWTSLQAAIAQFGALSALYLIWGGQPLIILVICTWSVTYLCARHFFSSFDEPLGSMLSHIWGYMSAGMTWVLGHWLLYYGFLAQPVLLISILSYGLAALYYLENNDRLSTLIKREIILIMTAVVTVVIFLSNWGDKTV